MCVAFKKVQSDDPQTPDSLGNTFTKAGEEGEPSPLLIPLIIAHYLHTALAAERSTGARLLPATGAAPLQLAKFVACAPDSDSSSWDALLPTEPWERGLLCHPPALSAPTAACQPQPLKNRADTCMLQCIESGNYFREGTKVVFSKKTELGGDGKEMRKGKKSWI